MNISSENSIEDDILKAKRLIEAIIFASAKPVSERLLTKRVPSHLDIKVLLKALQDEYKFRGVNLMQAGKSWAFRTADDLTELLKIELEVSRKMSRAAIETMAIIAYHQPITRVEIEEIRGVSLSKGTMDNLFEKGWIKPRGRRETPGKPINWVTTDDFLNHFGIQHTSDLPGLQELKEAGLLETGPAQDTYPHLKNPTQSPNKTTITTLEETHSFTNNDDENVREKDVVKAN